MNLLVRKAGPILGLALFLFACEEPGEIGLELSPDTGDFTISSVEIPVKASVGLAEPYLIKDSTYNHRIIAMGKKTDEDFGSVEITGYSDIILPSPKIKIEDNAVFERAYLSLRTQNYFGNGEVFDEQIIRVYELDEELKSANYTNESYQYKNELLSILSLDTADRKSNKPIYGNLPDDFGLRIFNAARQDSIINDDLLALVKGLAFVPDVENNLLFQVNTNTPLTNITLKYSVDGKEDSTILYLNKRPVYFVSTDYSGTEFEGLTNNNQVSDETDDLYLNSINGAFIELDFSALQELRDSLGPMVINTAELLFENVEIDTFYSLSNNFNLNAFEKTSDFDFSRQSFFKVTEGGDVFFTGINRSEYRFSMNNVRSQDNISNALFFVSSVVPNEYTPTSSRTSGAFVDFVQSIVASNSNVENPKYVFFPDSYGKSFQQIRFSKDKIRLKLYFSYLRSAN